MPAAGRTLALRLGPIRVGLAVQWAPELGIAVCLARRS